MHLPCSQHEAKIRVNHTRCCFLFKRNERPHPAAVSLRCPVVSQQGLWKHCSSGWLKFLFSPGWRPWDTKWSLLALAAPETALVLITEGRRTLHTALQCLWEMGSKSQTFCYRFLHPSSHDPVESVCGSHLDKVLMNLELHCTCESLWLHPQDTSDSVQCFPGSRACWFKSQHWWGELGRWK